MYLHLLLCFLFLILVSIISQNVPIISLISRRQFLKDNKLHLNRHNYDQR